MWCFRASLGKKLSVFSLLLPSMPSPGWAKSADGLASDEPLATWPDEMVAPLW
jgi:hypothetical protein